MRTKAEITRRDFLKETARAGAAAAALGGLAPARVLGANDKIRVGAIGTGERCQYLMGLFKDHPSVELVAVCDVYGPRRDEAMKIAVPGAQAYLDYHELLDRKDIDAVIIGSPDHWHKQMLVDAAHAVTRDINQ